MKASKNVPSSPPQRFFSDLYPLVKFQKNLNMRTLSTNILNTHVLNFGRNIYFSFFGRKCKHCGKFFNQLTYCMEQEKHTEMKSYTCKYCAKSFSNLSKYKRHERAHTGKKPYTCKYCKKSFRWLSNCREHE